MDLNIYDYTIILLISNLKLSISSVNLTGTGNAFQRFAP